MNKINTIIEMLNEVEGHMMSLNLDNITLAELHALPRLMRQINALQKHSAAHLEDLANEVRKDCYNIEEAAANK